MSLTTLNLPTTLATSALVSYVRDVLSATVAGFRTHRLLYAIAFATYALGILECLRLGLPVNFSLVAVISGTTGLFLSLTIAIWLICRFIKLWWTGYQGSPGLALAQTLTNDIMPPGRVSNTLHAILVNGIFFIGFLAIKKSIPVVNGSFAWDQTFMEMDRTLHFGYLPHEWLQPLLGSQLGLFLINLNYNLWFVVLLGCYFWFGFSRRDSFLRQRYLTAYMMAWFLGTCILGTLLSSAGPCFYGFVTDGSNPYGDLMTNLRAANQVYPIWAILTQDTLWQTYLAGHGDVEGVSAMPSMHVGSSVLFVCLAFGWGKRWFIYFTIPFALAIFAGSVMLGWHYAVDGYLGGLVAWFSWWLAGKLHKGLLENPESLK